MKITIPLSPRIKLYIEKIQASRMLQIGTITILLLAIGITVYSVQKIQELRSQARVGGNKAENGLSITNDKGTPLLYEGNNTYTTNSLEVKLKIEDLEKLTQ